MIAREWKTRCPRHQKKGFIEYLYKTGIKDSAETDGYQGAQIFARGLNDQVEITLITYWDSMNSIKGFAGDDISLARLYPEDYRYELDSDDFVLHYEVLKNICQKK
ncbi:MAG TPA: antibiotic biosynthesis monooxygenase [Gammaproteobacteria bacterium]|nr:antibiotic biosynthesis monooxygenase [Gammaproteobacteria bacterium]